MKISCSSLWLSYACHRLEHHGLWPAKGRFTNYDYYDIMRYIYIHICIIAWNIPQHNGLILITVTYDAAFVFYVGSSRSGESKWATTFYMQNWSSGYPTLKLKDHHLEFEQNLYIVNQSKSELFTDFQLTKSGFSQLYGALNPTCPARGSFTSSNSSSTVLVKPGYGFFPSPAQNFML